MLVTKTRVQQVAEKKERQDRASCLLEEVGKERGVADGYLISRTRRRVSGGEKRNPSGGEGLS